MHPYRPRPAHEPTLSIVVPARNEARNLELVLPQLPSVHQVVVVDGHSVDDTREVVERTLPTADFVQQTRRGKGNALACGFEAATGDIVVMFDADGSADPREIDAFVGALLTGADVAKGSRVLAAGGSLDITVLRDLGNKALTRFTNVLFRTRYTDLCYGYNAFWRDVLPKLALPTAAGEQAQWGDGFEIETMLNCRVATAGLQVHEVPSVELPRVHGVSNLNAVRDGLRVLGTILAERRRHRAEGVSVPAAEAVPGARKALRRRAAARRRTAGPGSSQGRRPSGPGRPTPSVIDLAGYERRAEQREQRLTG